MPAKLSRKEQKDAGDQLKQARQQLRAQANPQDILALEMMQLKFQFEDYIKSDLYDPDKKFGYFLKAYLGVIRPIALPILCIKTYYCQAVLKTRCPLLILQKSKKYLTSCKVCFTFCIEFFTLLQNQTV